MTNAEMYIEYLDWQLIEDCMGTFAPVSSGYTLAKRGVVTLSNGRLVFIKIGTDNITKEWIKKEIDAYIFLKSKEYQHIPKLLSIREDRAGFALEYLSANDGWEWDNTWDEGRLAKTLEAMDSLANININTIPESFTTIQMVRNIGNSWKTFIDDTSAKAALISKLRLHKREDIASKIFDGEFLEQSFDFDFPQDTLTHYDVRNDNCAWSTNEQQVKLIDWNWVQLGNRDIDTNSLLVNVKKSGFPIPDNMPNRLNNDALLWLAGSWFTASISSIDDSKSEDSRLRDYQLQSAITAFDLAR